jgi:DNA-directed RNA polymerase subunit F
MFNVLNNSIQFLKYHASFKTDTCNRYHYTKNGNKNLSYTVERLKSSYSILASTFSDWTKDINQQLEEQLLEKILDLHLQCKTQQEIASILGLKNQSTVSDKITKITQILEELSKNPISDLAIEYPNFALKHKLLSAFSPQLYNVWNLARNNNENRLSH